MVHKISQLTYCTNSAIRQYMRRLTTSALMLGVMTGLGGCVQVSAPDKPIVINLNINIKQEVVYRLNSDAQDLISKEAEIF